MTTKPEYYIVEASALPEVSAEFVEEVTHLGSRTVTVIGCRLNYYGNAGRTVALV